MTTKKAIQRLTKSNVLTLPAGEYTDPSVRGLQLRVRKGATKVTRTWLFRYKWKSRALRLVIGHLPSTSLKDARQKALVMRRNLDDGINPQRAKPRRHTPTVTLPGSISAFGLAPDDKHSIEFLVYEFIERYLKPNRKRPDYAIRILNVEVLPMWKGRDARTIEAGEVIGLLDGIVDRGSRVMANRVAAILTQLFKFGIHRRIVTASPVQLLYRPGGKEKSRERALSDDELKAFLTYRDDILKSPRIAHALMLLLLTLQRRSEVALATWLEFDFKAKLWRIPDEHAKGGRGYLVPLTDWAIEELQALKKLAKRSRFVFPVADGSGPADAKLITRSVARCLAQFKAKGIKAFTPHDLRRTGRTGLSRLKVEPHIAERVLNHVQEKLAGTYDVYEYLDEKRAALNKWAEHLDTQRRSETQAVI